MTNLGWLKSDVSVPELLERCGFSPTRRNHAWRFKLPGAQNISVTAGEDDGFVTLCATAARLRAAQKLDLGCLLELNARLPGGAKLAIDGKSHCLLVLAEIPCDGSAEGADAETLCRRVNDASAGLKTALELLDSLATDSPSPTPGDDAVSARQAQAVCEQDAPGNDQPAAHGVDDPQVGSSPPAQSPQWEEIELEFSSDLTAGDSAAEHDLGPHAEQLRERCLQAGWPASQRRDGSLSVVLGVPEGSCAGRFEALGPEAVRVRSDPCWPIADEAVCRQAIDYLLLRASGAVRMSGAAGVADPSGRARGPYVWQVRWESLPEAAELSVGLTALSVACRLTIREVEALGDAGIAEQYLAFQQWPKR